MLNKLQKKLTILDNNGNSLGFAFRLDDLTPKLFVTLDDNKPFKDTMRVDVDISVERKTPLFLITMSTRDEKLFNELLENNQKFKETVDYYARTVVQRVREKNLTKSSYNSYEQAIEINRSLNKIFDLSN